MITDTTRARDASRAYALLRLTLGVNIAMHGLVRIAAGIGPFAEGMARGFEKTLMPVAAARAFGWVLPPLELAVGALIAAGLWVRGALTAGALLMIALTFGMTLRQEWEVVGLQLIYALVYAVLIARAADDAWSIDAWRRARAS